MLIQAHMLRVVKLFFAALLLMLVAFGTGGLLSAQAQTAPNGYATQADRPLLNIQGVSVNPATGVLTIQGSQPFNLNNAKNYSMLKLPNPNRVIIEIPDARLGMSQGTVPIRQNGIREVELSQKQSQFYNAVRLIVYVDDTQTLWKLNAANQDNALVVGPMGAPVMSQALLPADVQGQAKKLGSLDLPNGVNVVEDIYYRDNILHLRGRGISKLEVKNRFTLSDPERLVIDLDNTSVASKDLLKPFAGNDPLIREIRVGQFDERTLRVVVETTRPEQFQIVYPASDKSMLTISPYLDSTIASLPSDVQLGQVKNVFLTRERGQSILRITTTSPMVQRVHKEDGKLFVDLLNTAANPGWIHYDEDAHPLVRYLKLEPLTAGQPNAKLVVDLASEKVVLNSDLSADGRTLEITLADGALASLGTGKKAPFPARIVIDAGHGGKDMGANRSGVNEKDLNLSLALMVKKELEGRGFKVYMTRDTDEFLPLPRITQITNNIKPDLFVSIHHNASTNPSLNGIETYYYTPQSKPLADRIHKQMASHVNAPDRGVRKAMFYVIHHTSVPAVLCEIGYVSNPAELRELQTFDRKSRSAAAVADGVVDYLKSKMSASAQ